MAVKERINAAWKRLLWRVKVYCDRQLFGRVLVPTHCCVTCGRFIEIGQRIVSPHEHLACAGLPLGLSGDPAKYGKIRRG